MTTPEHRPRPRRRIVVVIAAVVGLALAVTSVVWARGGFRPPVPTTGVTGFGMRGDLAQDEGLLDDARQLWTWTSDEEERPTGEVTALWAGVVSTDALEGHTHLLSTAADEADLVVLSDGSHLVSVLRPRDGSGAPLGSEDMRIYHRSALPGFLATTMDVGPGLVLLADYRTVAAEGLASTSDENNWHPVQTELHDGLFQRGAPDDELVTVRVDDEGVLLLDKFGSTFFLLTDVEAADGREDPSWAALVDPERASDARAAVLAAGEAGDPAWESTPADETATWIADVELAGGQRGTVFAVGTQDIDAYSVLALGTGGDVAVPGTVLGKHLAGYATPGTAARIPPLGAAWVSPVDGDAQLLVIGTEDVTSLDIQIGTSRTAVTGRVAVVDLPPEGVWVGTGDPEPSELPQFAVVGQTADGWPVPLDGH